MSDYADTLSALADRYAAIAETQRGLCRSAPRNAEDHRSDAREAEKIAAYYRGLARMERAHGAVYAVRNDRPPADYSLTEARV